MTIKYRGIWSFFFVLGAILCGLAVGTAIGGKWFVPSGSGLAGPFMALGYGILGAVIAAGLALIPVFSMRGRNYLFVAAPVIVAGLTVAVLMGLKVLESRAERDEYLATQRASLPPFSVELAYLSSWKDMPFSQFAFDSAAGEFRVTRADGTTCRGPVDPTGEEKLTLLVALRHVEILLANEPNPCSSRDAPMAKLSFEIAEHRPPASRGDIDITLACVQRHGQIADLLETSEAVYEQLRDTCE